MLRNQQLLLVTLALGCGGRVEDGVQQRANTVADGSTTSQQTCVGNCLAAGGSNVSGFPNLSMAWGGAAGRSTVGQPLALVAVDSEFIKQAESTACNAVALEPEYGAANIEWVIDASHSMGEFVPGSGVSKWDLTWPILADAMTQISNRPKCGMGSQVSRLFPGMQTAGVVSNQPQSAKACVDPSSAMSIDSPAEATTVRERLRAVVPTGGTPTLDAYRSVAAQSLPTSYTSYPLIILVTDGKPSIGAGCTQPDPGNAAAPGWPNVAATDDRAVASTEDIINEIAHYAPLGVTTVVVGTAGSESSRSWLSRAAIAGGRPNASCDRTGIAPYCHIDLSTDAFAVDHIAELTLVGSLVLCDLPIPQQVNDDEQHIDLSLTTPIITVTDGTNWRVPLDQGPAESCEFGFRVIDQQRAEICPKACALMKTECATRLTALFHCWRRDTRPDLQ